MRRGWVAATATALAISGCGDHVQIPSATSSLGGRSDKELARFLPTLADYPWTGWSIAQQAPPPPPSEPESGPTTVEPSGCDHAPYAQARVILARTQAYETNLGPSGFGGEASVSLLSEQGSQDLIKETRDWATHCANFTVKYSDDGPGNPTSVSVLPPQKIAGVDVLRVHLTDNRESRFQTEGSRESVVYLARVRGIVVSGSRHDSGDVLDDVFTTTIRRLLDDHPNDRPLSEKIFTDSLTGRTDQDLSKLLPTIFDLPEGWSLAQISPIVGARALDYLPRGYTAPPGCEAIPFMNTDAPRADISRDFREIASATGDPKSRVTGGLDYWQGSYERVMLNIENPAADVVGETTFWARQCATYTGDGKLVHGGTVEISPISIDGQQVYSIHAKRELPTNFDLWMLVARVRGVLVTALSPGGKDGGPLLRKTIKNLQHAEYFAPPTPVPPPSITDPYFSPPGALPLPAPTSGATEKLSRIAKGTLVDPDQYHLGGYLPGDTPTRTPDYLHFRSPTGAIVCTWRKYSLYCDVPHGSYARTPKPAGQQGNWSDTLVHFGWDNITSGGWAQDPVVYAESKVLPYGSTIRFASGPDLNECLMGKDGLTCVDYTKRMGMHLSREDLTPLAATDALQKDTR